MLSGPVPIIGQVLEVTIVQPEGPSIDLSVILEDLVHPHDMCTRAVSGGAKVEIRYISGHEFPLGITACCINQDLDRVTYAVSPIILWPSNADITYQ